MAASIAVQNDPKLRAFYLAKRQEGKHHGTAIGAICRKLLARATLSSRTSVLTLFDDLVNVRLVDFQA